MSGIAAALEIINVLISVSTNALQSIQKYNDLIAKAQAEGRDITDDELAALKAESDALTAETLANLDGSPE